MLELYLIGCLIMFGACLTIPKHIKATKIDKILLILFSWIGLGVMLGELGNSIDKIEEKNGDRR